MLRPRSFHRSVALVAAVLCLLAAQSTDARAGDFQIAPMSLELRKGSMSGTITVTNEAKVKLSLQLSAKAWDQDGEGRDRYAATEDVIFYPKIMTVGPGEQRVIRLGLKGAPGAGERTYRLFLDEIAVRSEGEPRKQAGVAIAVRISLPVFLAPVRVNRLGRFEKISLEQGTVTALIANGGNVSFKLRTVTARGKAADGTVLFEQERAGWYVLSGVSRAFRFEVPPAVCPKLATIEVHAAGETLSVSGTLNVSKELCRP